MSIWIDDDGYLITLEICHPGYRLETRSYGVWPLCQEAAEILAAKLAEEYRACYRGVGKAVLNEKLGGVR